MKELKGKLTLDNARAIYQMGNDVLKALALEYFTVEELEGKVEEVKSELPTTWDDRFWTPDTNIYATELQALQKLIILRDIYNGEPIEEIINRRRIPPKYICIDGNFRYVLAFKSSELRDQFSTNFSELIEIAKPLL